MGQYLNPVEEKQSFDLFSVEHVATLGIAGLLIICLCLLTLRIRKSQGSSAVRIVLAAILLLTEISFQIWTLSFGKWSLQSSLPIELSDLAVILAAVMLISGSRRLFYFLYFAGIGSSLQALLTPDLGAYTFPHFRYIEFFTAHAGMIAACLLLILIKGYRPVYRWIWITFFLVNVYGIIIFFFNRMTGANYLYLMHKPSASLLDFLGPWPWYLLSMEGVMLLVFHILYIPFLILKLKKIRNKKVSR
ncbi:TIGR02206 family membrane protein [Sporolactobacillus sp. Y61]|uniref:TIGR02206 family membrane protein n=1 Tax=Sporolactobacillus sp. Y61 TaxID=3160863 RepID=A0AAU8IGG3_9BACL